MSNLKYECNESYFSVPNIENSYWAGFIAADGYINDRYDSSISLSGKYAENILKSLLLVNVPRMERKWNQIQ